MIRTFSDKGLSELFENGRTAKISPNFHSRAIRILDFLEAAQKPSDMDVPGLRFHALKGDRAGYFSVSVNGPWRITFAFEGVDVIDVDLEQYH